MNLSAYYFAFESTGEPVVDAVLSAVATAGHGAHHTESWVEHGYDTAIQDAAAKAAAELTRLREIERVAIAYVALVDHRHTSRKSYDDAEADIAGALSDLRSTLATQEST